MPYSSKQKKASEGKQSASRPRRTKGVELEELDQDDDLPDDDPAGHDQRKPEDLKHMFQRLMSQEEHTEWLNSKTSLVHETIQNKSKELVKIGVLAVDEVNSPPRKFRAQEIDYEKYYEDHQLSKQRQDDGFRQLQSCFSLILEDLGRTRAYEVNATSELVKDNPSHRQEILRNFSKSMRSRFEEARKKEKEIEDAEALIEMVKKILYF